jgi:NMD protein affecting ribosome stability and mRNA decay
MSEKKLEGWVKAHFTHKTTRCQQCGGYTQIASKEMRETLVKAFEAAQAPLLDKLKEKEEEIERLEQKKKYWEDCSEGLNELYVSEVNKNADLKVKLDEVEKKYGRALMLWAVHMPSACDDCVFYSFMPCAEDSYAGWCKTQEAAFSNDALFDEEGRLK